MSEQALSDRLSQIVSRWTLIRPGGSQPPDVEARNELLVRYHHAIYNYLLARLRDPHAAGELLSNFALRVLEEERLFEKVDPERGRFRDYLRGILSRMVIDHYRRLGGGKERPFGDEGGAEVEGPEADPFPPIWRQELLNQAWKALQAVEDETGQPYASAVKLKEEQPDLRSKDVAERLTQKLGRPFTAAGVRQVVHRGRELFGDLLVAEVVRSLRRSPADLVLPQRVEEELIELGLLFSYCKDALKRYAGEA